MLRNAIHSELKKQQHDDGQSRYRVLLDENDLTAGDKWRTSNDEWLRHSDGVVLLLNQAALREDSYVPYEFTILWLRWREAREHFRFVIVRFPDVEDELLNRKLKPLQLSEVQQIKLSELFRDNTEQTDTDNVKSEIALVAGKVVSAMQKLHVDRSSHWIEEQLVKTLNNQTSELIHLRPLCDLLHLDPGILFGKTKLEASQLIIRRLLNPEKPIGPERLADLRITVDHLVTVFPSQEHVQRLINYALPHCWVNADAATRLCWIAHRTEGPKIVVWTRNWNLSEKMYLRRAWCKHLRRVVQVCAKSGNVNDWNNKVHEALALGFNRDPATTSTDKLRAQIRKFLVEQNEPVWVVLSAALTGHGIMKKLTSEWPEVLFFVFEPEDENAKPADWEWSEFERVTPALDLSLEKDAAAEWADLMEQCGVNRERIAKEDVFI